MRRVFLGRRCLAGLSVVAGCTLSARDITDMAGRTVTIPDHITKVFAAQPYTNVLMYIVAPDLMVGLLNPPREETQRFVRPEAAKLPVLVRQAAGGGAGSGPGRPNLEAVLALKPDFALVKGGPNTEREGTEAQYAKISLPVVFVDIDRIADYPAGIEFIGKLLGREERARQLSNYAQRVLAEVDHAVAGIPPEKRVRVYYAESTDGLATESDQSFHADAIKMAGGTIVHQGDLKTHIGMEKVSLEQILVYNPEVIVSQDPEFARTVYQDARWKGVKAVAAHRVYTVPRTPHNWIDRPPSVMRIMGVQWLANRFYPEIYNIDIRNAIREFHRLFMGIEVSDADLDDWLK
jgi:iron complex transport system substrate-binding protein